MKCLLVHLDAENLSCWYGSFGPLLIFLLTLTDSYSAQKFHFIVNRKKKEISGRFLLSSRV